MTKWRAKKIHDRFVKESLRSFPRRLPTNWEPMLAPEMRPVADGWEFVHRNLPYGPVRILVLTGAVGPFCVAGAIGNAYHGNARLGLPRSHERWIGSGPGRYQKFEEGIIVWDAGQSSDPDLAYPRFAPHTANEGRRVPAAIAFTDLRGFTNWSAREETTATDVDQLLSSLEQVVQDAFSRSWCKSIFLKGLGDGVMIVSEHSEFIPPGMPDWIEGGSPQRICLLRLGACEPGVSHPSVEGPRNWMRCRVRHASQGLPVWADGLSRALGERGSETAAACVERGSPWDEGMLAPTDDLSKFHVLLPQRGYRISPSDFIGRRARGECRHLKGE